MLMRNLDPLELYAIEISGVYSNHPNYRSEVDITRGSFISGNAGATVTATEEGGYYLGGVFELVRFKGSITGTATLTPLSMLRLPSKCFGLIMKNLQVMPLPV